ncbi:hypothetical protein [Teichococcus vastitatis]|jgi:hypothetical protein|uniref:Uncharacterized protein n=1 Tax=Teichococcus vastitatis TaxID=2307076 RepID=A0ABS9W686_9PROT|nr:hypothetical protein [Pseudoroseomonas vastitatis]MCI0754553.1 hypothetical protein [Pseudoroseomonas vastitatis]
MTSSKHAKGGMGSEEREEGLMQDTPRPPDDLERNPGIGSSKGVFGRGTDPEVLQGENTDEGDTMNDTTAQGGVNPDQTGRTNS